MYDRHFRLNSKISFIMFGQVWFLKMCLNTSQQVVHNDKTYSKACALNLLQLIVGVWCIV